MNTDTAVQRGNMPEKTSAFREERFSVTVPFQPFSGVGTDRFPAVSILIPTYERKSLLKETLAAVLKQSFQDFEIIVLDDGSRERPDREICEIAAALPDPDRKIRYYRQPNSGPSAARNRLLTLARGRWILFLDDDDRMTPDMLQRLVSEAEASPEPVAAYCGYRRIDEHGNFCGIPNKVENLPSGWITDQLYRRIFLSSSQVLIPRDVLLKHPIRFRKELRLFEDTVFFLELSLHIPFRAVNSPLLCRRRHSGNLSSSGKNAVHQLHVWIWLMRKPEFACRLTQKTLNERFAQLYFRAAGEETAPERKMRYRKRSLQYRRRMKTAFLYWMDRLRCIVTTAVQKTVFQIICIRNEFCRKGGTLTVSYYRDPEKAPLESSNFGDDLNRTFLSELTGKEVIPYSFSVASRCFSRPHYLCIGSILHRCSRPGAVVWGSGMKSPATLRGKRKRIRVCAVRGPLTRARLLESGVDCPPVYGDPAILMPLLYHPAVPEKRYRIGLIPHLHDLHYPVVSWYAEQPGVHLFDLRKYPRWRQFVDELLSCEMVLSSSLHGCILADAYGIPNLQVKFVADLERENFKFEDYHLSCRASVPIPLDLGYADRTVEDLAAMKTEWVPPVFDRESLMKAAPFPLNIPR